MKSLLLGVSIAALTGSAVYSQDLPKPQPNAVPPAPQSAPATPDMKAQIPPEPAQPMTSAADSKNAGFVPEQQWVGRYVYSSDNKDLGKVAAVKINEVDFDMGGFLGLGSTRKHVSADQVGSVQRDRIVLRITKAEAEKLPADK